MGKMFNRVGLAVTGLAASVAPSFALDTTVTDMFAAADVAGLATSQKTMLTGFIVMAVAAAAFGIVIKVVKKAPRAS